MRAYMGYSRSAGRGEGAVLIFADTVREARVLAWHSVLNEMCDGEYLDVEVSWIRNSPWIFGEMLETSPHVVERPRVCSRCMTWGGSEIGEDGICDDCKEEEAICNAEEELTRKE